MYLLAKILSAFFILSLGSEIGFGQEVAQLAEAYVRPLTNLSAGVFSFSTSEGLLFKTTPFRDTCEVQFANLGSPENFQFLIHNGRKIIYYHHDSLYKIDIGIGTFTLEVMPAAQVVKECQNIFFSPILTRGANILKNLDRPSATINVEHATDEPNEVILKIGCGNLGQGNTAIEDLKVEYKVKDSLVYGYEDHYGFLGGNVSHEGHLLQYCFADSMRISVEATCEQIRSEIESGKYTPQSFRTTEPQEQLLHVGATAPDITGKSELGITTRLSSMDADLFVLDFWYAGCGPCLELLPSIQKLNDEFKDKRVAVVGINPYDDLSVLTRVVRAKHLTYPELACSSDYVEDFGITAFPTTYILDRNLRVLSVLVGYSPGRKDEIRAELLTHLKRGSKPTLPVH